MAHALASNLKLTAWKHAHYSGLDQEVKSVAAFAGIDGMTNEEIMKRANKCQLGMDLDFADAIAGRDKEHTALAVLVFYSGGMMFFWA